MKNKIYKTTLFSLIVILITPVFSGLTYGVENFESLKVVTTQMPSYPTRLVSEGIFEGFAQVVIRVNEEGKLTDTYLSAYSHPEFGRLAEKYIKLWTFQPAKLNGEPLSVIKSMDFKFEDNRGVFSLLPMEAAAMKMNFGPMDTGGKRIYSPHELDEIPVPLEIETPLYPDEFRGQGIEGTATVIFYIDEEGEVRMPHVTENSQDHFGMTALSSVKKWKFKPPLVKGKQVAILSSLALACLFEFQASPHPVFTG
jgi:TonB family protein